VSEGFDFRVDWADHEAEKIEGDHFAGVEGIVEQLLHEAAVPEELGEAGKFEWSQDRAVALEAALSRIGASPGARICTVLSQLLDGNPAPERLDEVEVWLHAQLPAWQGAVEDAPDFNQSLSSASDGLHLALEVVALARDPAQQPMARNLLAHVEQYFQAARKSLLEAEP
jgi:hypothetical protein